MGRNAFAIGRLSDAARLQCDAVALDIVKQVDAECFQPGHASKPPLCLNAIEFCFFTLVFRHTRQYGEITRSRELLEGALDGSIQGVGTMTQAGRGFCERFLDETQEVYRTKRAQEYIERAMATDAPYTLHSLRGPKVPPSTPGTARVGSSSSMQVLDTVCVDTVNSDPDGFCRRFMVADDGKLSFYDGK